MLINKRILIHYTLIQYNVYPVFKISFHFTRFLFVSEQSWFKMKFIKHTKFAKAFK